MSASATESTADREIVVTRLFHAPRELVFEAWTNPKHLIQWFGPRGFTHTFHEISVKPGGVWRFIMHGPDGADYPNYVVWQEVDKPSKLVYRHGEKLGDPGTFVSTVTFEDRDGKTFVTARAVFNTKAEREMVEREYHAVQGAIENMDRCEEHVALMSVPDEFVISRTFDAPRELVWEVCTKPEHMKNWFGPKGYVGKVAKMDFRVGGMYHYCIVGPDGKDMWGKFVFRYINEPERIHFLSGFSDEHGGTTRHPMAPVWPAEMLSKFIFTEENGKTTFTVRWVPFNANDAERKAFIEMQKSMVTGWTGTMDQLTDYLDAIQRK
jgi:uncharacterized protein YndB with AHSA1/START domain